MAQMNWIPRPKSGGAETPPEQPTPSTFALGPTKISADSPAEQWKRWLLSLLPAAGGTVGGIMGTAAGGPVGGVVGATIGQAGAEASRQLLVSGLYGTGPQTSAEAAIGLGEQAFVGGASELVGQKAAQMAAPVLKSAVAHYAKALAPSGTAEKVYAQEAAEEMAKRFYPPTGKQAMLVGAEGGAESSGAAVGAAERRLTQQFAQTPPANIPSIAVDAKAIRQGLLELRERSLIPGSRGIVGNEKMLANVDANIAKLDEIVTKQGQFLSPETVIGWRRILDEQVKHAGEGFTKDLADASLAEANKRTANILRKELKSTYPDLDRLNAEFHFWGTVRDLTKARAVRETGEQKIKYGPFLAARLAVGGAAGVYVGGPWGGLAGAFGVEAASHLVEALRSPGWQTLSGYTKARLAQALKAKNTKNIIAITSRILSAPKTTSRSPQTAQPPQKQTANQRPQPKKSQVSLPPVPESYPNLRGLFRSEPTR